MLTCPTCAAENDEFAITCIRCKGFLQNRVPNLNFFETAWGILESPKSTFRTIALAEHKNYALFLFSGFGIAVSFTVFWYLRLGVQFESLLELIPWAIGGGIAGGLLCAVLIPLLFHAIAKVFGGKASFRNSYALIAYAMVPVVLSVVIVLPVELMTFGMYLFTSNPHPYVIKPLSYVVLIVFDTLMASWTIVLTWIGTSVVHRTRWAGSGFVVAILLSLLGGMFFVLTSTTLHMLPSGG